MKCKKEVSYTAAIFFPPLNNVFGKVKEKEKTWKVSFLFLHNKSALQG